MAGQTGDPSVLLIERHAVNQLRAYEGSLAFAAHIIQNGWLPAEDDPETQQHLETLRQHLRETGHQENDSFLLRLGLCVPGMQRGIVPPMIVLEPSQGGFPSRRQREAEGQICQLREALAVGRQFVPGLSPDTQKAIAEMLSLLQSRSVPNDRDWLRWFGELTPGQSERLAQRAIEFLDVGQGPLDEIGTRILQDLACFRQRPLNEACCRALIEREVFWPSSLFRDAGDEVAGRIISLIEDTSDSLSLHHLLLALAWTRSTAAHEAFRQWTNKQPRWASALHVPPAECLPHAGWSLDEAGQRHDLISTDCFHLLLAEGEAPGRIRCRTPVGEPCPSCGGPLVLLFDFRRMAGERFLGTLAEAPRRVLCCLHCSCFQPVFAAYDSRSAARWHSGYEPCEVAYAGSPESRVCERDDSPCPSFVCAEPFAVDDASTLGGIPMWLQDAEFPRCIECGQLMTFLAQHDNGPLGEEGVHYAFFCARCRVSAVSYQQT